MVTQRAEACDAARRKYVFRRGASSYASMWNKVVTIACLVSGLLLVQSASADEKLARQIEIKLVDEHNLPIADALTVVAPYTANDSQDRGSTNDLGVEQLASLQDIQAATNMAGEAVLALPITDEMQRFQPMQVSVWKAGYAIRSLLVARRATIQLYKSIERPVRIVNSQGQPLEGATVSIVAPGALQSRQDWQAECVAKTNKQGIAYLPGHLPAFSVTIEDTTGRTFQGSYLPQRSNGFGVAREPHEMLIFKLPALGRITGRVPPALALQFKPLVHASSMRAGRSAEMAYIASKIKVEDDGSFVIDHVPTGQAWCYFSRTEAYKLDEELPKQLLVPAQVEVLADQTSTVEFSSQPAAIVTGKVVAEKAADLSDVRVQFIAFSGEGLQPIGSIAIARCDAHGNYRLPLTSGKYSLTVVSDRNTEPSKATWYPSDFLQFEIGPGAASVTAPPLEILATQIQPAVVKEFTGPRIIGEDEPPMSVSIPVPDRGSWGGPLSVDGSGWLSMAKNSTVGEIHLSRGQSSRIFSQMIDTDPSQRFELEFDKRLKGAATNLSVISRVVDAAGKPLAGIPVRLTLSYEATADSDQFRLPAQQRVVADLTSEADGTVRMLPTQLFRAFTLPNELANSTLKFIFTLAPVGDEKSVSRYEAIARLNSWDQAQITIPNLVFSPPPAQHMLTGTLVDSHSQPLVNQMVWLSQDRSISRAITDERGHFSFAQVASPAWLLCEAGWTIKQVIDASQPVELKASSATDSPAEGNWSSVSLEQRRKWAKDLIEKAKNVPLPVQMDSMPITGFLEPDAYYQMLLKANRKSSDQHRLQFISFWNGGLEDEKLERLADSMVQDDARAQVLWVLARRHPSLAAYQRVMESIPLPDQQANGPTALPIIGLDYRGQDYLIMNTALELYRFGGLEPYREKLQQFISTMIERRDKQGDGREAPMPTGLILCNALLGPQAFADEVVASLQTPESELQAQERAVLGNATGILLRLAPTSVNQVPIVRIPFTDELLLELGRLAPLQALDALQKANLRPDMLRWLVLGAMLHDSPEAQTAFKTVHSTFTDDDALGIVAGRMSSRNPELYWIRAAQRMSPELGKQAAWQVAFELLRTASNESSGVVFNSMQRPQARMLEMIYAIRHAYPQLAQQMSAEQVPKFIEQIESDATRPFARSYDLSIATALAPEAITQLMNRLDEQLNAELKNAGAQRSAMYRLHGNRAMKISCVKGLLVDDLAVPEF